MLDNVQNKAANKTSVLSLVQVALMAAIVYVATAVIHVPSAFGQGVLHLGDSAVFIAAILLGKKKGATAAAIGMCLFDLLSGYGAWAPFTFVIKGAMGYIAAMIAYRGECEGKKFFNNFFAFLIAGIVMIIGYFFAGWILYDFPNAVGSIFNNVLQVALGMLIALPLSELLKKRIKL